MIPIISKTNYNCREFHSMQFSRQFESTKRNAGGHASNAVSFSAPSVRGTSVS